MRRLFLAVTIGAVIFTSCAKEKAPPIPVQNLESVNSKTSEEQNEHSLGIVVSEELPGGSRAELGSQVTAMLVYQYRICLDNPVNCIRASFLVEAELDFFENNLNNAIANDEVKAFFEDVTNWEDYIPMSTDDPIYLGLLTEDIYVEVTDYFSHAGVEVEGMMLIFRKAQASGEVVIALPYVAV